MTGLFLYRLLSNDLLQLLNYYFANPSSLNRFNLFENQWINEFIAI